MRADVAVPTHPRLERVVDLVETRALGCPPGVGVPVVCQVALSEELRFSEEGRWEGGQDLLGGCQQDLEIEME